MPWFTDFGVLYYRTDLLEKYGFSHPPETWEDLEHMAQTIQDGERTGNQQFWGFVWQGAKYEGLTCNALEWISSQGGGTIISPDAKITVNDPAVARALNRAKGWVGTISPPNVRGYMEDDAGALFQDGNAAFLRHWPAFYATGNQEQSPIKGMFAVAPLPADPGQPHAGTIGGWQLGVSTYSKEPEAAFAFVQYMTSRDVQNIAHFSAPSSQQFQGYSRTRSLPKTRIVRWYSKSSRS
jgi:trehalose/maltose transport system substrate-binding protein